jgi:hypothetical protein
LQVGGSCWFMATIVAMFYSQRSKKLLLKKFKEKETEKKINNEELYKISEEILEQKISIGIINKTPECSDTWEIE